MVKQGKVSESRFYIERAIMKNAGKGKVGIGVMPKNAYRTIFLLCLIGGFGVFHLFFINADTPASLTYGAGTYCDEGYKTLSARNMVLFGDTHWTELDEYAGWVKGSPVTFYFNYLMFNVFGVFLGFCKDGECVVCNRLLDSFLSDSCENIRPAACSARCGIVCI
jgi:hypothetical protein